MPTFPYFNFGYAPGELEYLNSERDEPMTNKQVIVGDEQAISPEAESGLPLPSASDDLVGRMQKQLAICEHARSHYDQQVASVLGPAIAELTSLRAQLAAEKATLFAAQQALLEGMARDEAEARLATATKALRQGAFQSRNRVRRAKGPRDRAIALAWEAFCQETLRSLTDRAKP